MEDELKECTNKRCRRKGVLVYMPDSKYCQSCGAKLKPAWVKSSTDQPLIDYSGGRNVDNRPEMLGWQQYKGTWQDYQKYQEAFRRGDPDALAVTIANQRQLTKGSSDNDTFTCTPDLEGCPIFKAKKDRSVRIPYGMFNKWQWLALRLDTEWLAYLKGTQDAEGIWTITEMYFPKQKVNCAHVDVEDGEVQEGTIGSVHSHVSMGAFFSAEDKKHFNHPVEIVVNRKGELAISCRATLECGRFTRYETHALLIDDTDNINTIEADLRSKLTKDESYGSKNVTTIQSSHYYHGMD